METEKQKLTMNETYIDKIAAVDFDGTISEYQKWEGPEVVGKILLGVRRAFVALNRANYKIVIFSSRASTLEGLQAIHVWLFKNSLHTFVSDVVCVKPIFTVLFDDRAWHVQSNKHYSLMQVVNRYLQTKEYEIP